MQSETDNILILGGGIGGLALALALKQHGLEWTVCERAPVLREVGAGLLLTPNATWILQRLGLLDAVIAKGHLTTSWRSWDDKAVSFSGSAQVCGMFHPSISQGPRCCRCSNIGRLSAICFWATRL